MKEKGCKSPEHVPNCPCPRCKKPEEKCQRCPILNIQHEIPKCIGKKILGMSNQELDVYTHPESKACHVKNDKNVTFIFYDMLKERRRTRIIFTKETVLEIRKLGLFKA